MKSGGKGVRKAVTGTVLLILIFLMGCGTAGAGEITFNASSGVRLRAHVDSIEELKFKGVVRQKLDISCGSAALATILQYYYGDPVPEDDIINDMVNGRTREQILQGVGFSLLEIKKAAEERGYKAVGLKGNMEALEHLRVPVIVLLNSSSYPHFVIVKGIVNGQVILADPALGNMTLDVGTFQSRWNGVFLVIDGNGRARLNGFKDSTYVPPSAPSAGNVGRFFGSSLRYYPFDPREF